MAILKSVWQKLSGKTTTTAATTPTAQAPASSALYTRNFHPSTQAKDDIPDHYAALWQLLSQRQLMEVKIEGSNHSYQTLILAIDIQRGLLWLDDLFPSQHLLETGDQISLRHHRNGEEIHFSSPILAWGSNYGAQGLAVSLPETSHYQPRRKHRRANLSEAAVGVKVRAIGQDIVYGSIQDISAGGLRLNVQGNLLAQLRHGALLPLCELNLSDELPIRCSARIRAFKLLRATHRYTQISVEFVDLTHERRQQLQQFINNILFLQQPNDELQVCRSA